VTGGSTRRGRERIGKRALQRELWRGGLRKREMYGRRLGMNRSIQPAESSRSMVLQKICRRRGNTRRENPWRGDPVSYCEGNTLSENIKAVGSNQKKSLDVKCEDSTQSPTGCQRGVDDRFLKARAWRGGQSEKNLQSAFRKTSSCLMRKPVKESSSRGDE